MDLATILLSVLCSGLALAGTYITVYFKRKTKNIMQENLEPEKTFTQGGFINGHFTRQEFKMEMDNFEERIERKIDKLNDKLDNLIFNLLKDNR